MSQMSIADLIYRHGEYVVRGEVEEDPSYQQIIPQIVLRCGQKVFIHKIPSTGSEGRLHDLWPIFLGGHVDHGDGDIEEAAQREFEEEINYGGNIIEKNFLGVVKLHTNPVDQVHTGLVWEYWGDREEFSDTGDKGIAEGKFIHLSELPNYEPNMTHWSRAFYPFLISL